MKSSVELRAENVAFGRAGVLVKARSALVD
jgi:hypothetical protein